MRKPKKDYKSEVLDIVETKDWDRAKKSNDKRLYSYILSHRNIDENCKIIWEHIKTETRDYESEILEIVETKNWDRAKRSNNESLYIYIYRNKDTDENCRTIWEHISSQRRDHESEISEIIETKDWGRTKKSNDKRLYSYILSHRDTDENCKIIWEHIKTETRDYESEILEIIETEDWDRARWSNDPNLYQYVKDHKNTDENCRIVSEHMIERHSSYTIKDYLQYYFEQGKPKNHNNTLYQWLTREINKGNQSCIDIKNLIIAAETYKDPVALETLDLIKNYLEKEGT